MGVTMEFLSPWSLAGLAFVPAVFLLGLLAPRGRPVRVGSLMLWRRVLPEGAAGKPSARIRLKDPLIWLDAAVVLLVVLACSRPALKTSAPAEPAATFVIDRAAHMWGESNKRSAFCCDVPVMAKNVLRAAGSPLIRVVLAPGDAGSVTSEEIASEEFSRVPWLPVLVAQDAWPVALAEAARRTDLPVLLATGITPTQAVPPNLFVLAPGCMSRNIGLTRVAARIEAGLWWLLVEAKADPTAPKLCQLVVSGDGKTLAQQDDFLAPGATVSQTFAMTEPPPKELKVELRALNKAVMQRTYDSFPYDDAAYLALEPAGRVRIALVGSPDPALRRALAACDDTAVMEVSQGAKVRTGQADLLIACDEAIPADWTGPAVTSLPPQAGGQVRPVGGDATVVRPSPLVGEGAGVRAPRDTT
ncbi:MAG: BatA domain-containing protein, partial [Planctomycetota bacterium]|nr:BatA domain-containing protein [Planctomycetota bacterium]